MAGAEAHLSCQALGWYVATPVFDGAQEDGSLTRLKAGCQDGKTDLRDGRTGQVLIGVLLSVTYMLKLAHLVDDKIHAGYRPIFSCYPATTWRKASLVAKFGEMEVWALEAYGALYLTELLTVKSDDTGRVKTYEAIVRRKRPRTQHTGIFQGFEKMQSFVWMSKYLKMQMR